ncbi:uncharacterized protein AMSG_10673 [Thecamonas trahens ATCC 50062]|uniref:Uncharacterized protein n=1 Tax=Thecamonas trahens ATCC 50062 TaxID=461836 RepID=A0A0L0DS35_THETB|nr:hypothetical protein AMSG_10673 [Thecamonas trahens ATCC 50062]KNC55075.1 hypothetical protein AMSG_10673 [Thecamonas trahens ATCC 50062]|eukprot:XP_013753260.1 hypothetical protein AMSG_10673 [Thecamonas trahens ATCC 50062]
MQTITITLLVLAAFVATVSSLPCYMDLGTVTTDHPRADPSKLTNYFQQFNSPTFDSNSPSTATFSARGISGTRVFAAVGLHCLSIFECTYEDLVIDIIY